MPIDPSTFMLAPGIGNVGDRVIAYLDHIGRVEGRIAVQVAEPVLRPRAAQSEGMPL